jgi:hypothetical protein
MAITNIQTYAIVNDFTPEENNLLAINWNKKSPQFLESF